MQMGAPANAMRAHEELFAYWAARRQNGALPARASIHPGDFKRHLPTISLTDVLHEPSRDYRLRLAGTGLYGIYGREITGQTLTEVYNAQAAAYWRTELDKVVESRKPGVGIHNLSWRGAGHLSILWLRLPLAGNGRNVDMILGYDVVVGQHAGAVSGIRAA
jgi:hypothetical protein